MSGGDDWQAGDLALCVRGGYLDGPALCLGWPMAGRIYAVADVRWDRHWGCSFLQLPDAPPNNWGDHCWAAERFRKINPLTDEERDEFLADLNAPVREPRHA